MGSRLLASLAAAAGVAVLAPAAAAAGCLVIVRSNAAKPNPELDALIANPPSWWIEDLPATA